MSGHSDHHHHNKSGVGSSLTHNSYKYEDGGGGGGVGGGDGSSSDSDSDDEKPKREKLSPPPNKVRILSGAVKQELTTSFDGHNGGSSANTTTTSIKRSRSEDESGGSVQDGAEGGGGVVGGNVGSSGGHDVVSVKTERKKNHLRTQLAHQIINSSTKVLKKPQYVVRPATVTSNSGSAAAFGLGALDPSCLLAVFRFLSPETLVTCSLVCKTWSTLSVDPVLWRRMNCAQYKLSASLLTAIVRRQPEHLILDWTSLAKRQLTWLIARLPALKHLSLQGTPIQAVLGLHTCLCPPLQVLDLSFVRGLNDSAIREILSAPKDSRPGLTDSKSRLRNLKVLRVAGTDVSDVALRYIAQDLPTLVHLDLASCQRVTDSGVAQIGTSPGAIKHLVELDLSSCKLVTDLSLDYLEKCEALTRLDLRHVPLVPTQAVIRFAAKSRNDLQVQDVKLVDKRRVPVPPPPVSTTKS